MMRLAAVAALLVVAACGPDAEASGPDGAADAVKELLTAVEAGSCPDVQGVVVTPDTIDCEQIGQLRGTYADQGVDLDDVTVTAGEANGSSVVVTVDLGTDDADETWQAEQVDGSWRVLFDSQE